jgi:hypothetical protein
VELLGPPTPEVDIERYTKTAGTRGRLAQLGTDFATAPLEFTSAVVKRIRGHLDEIDEVRRDPHKRRKSTEGHRHQDVRNAWDKLDLGRQRTIVDVLLTIKVLPIGKCMGTVFKPRRRRPGLEVAAYAS